jgi:very-short-patch-repair endonuclease
MKPKEQRTALIAAIATSFSDVKVECTDLPWLEVPDAREIHGPLEQIFTALRSHRGFTSFARPGQRLRCDILIPSQKLIVEYDERQHFTIPRAIALRLYPAEIAIGFDRGEWIAHCETIAATDNDPPYRDEQRAFYDSVRDLRAAANSYCVARLKHGSVDWRNCNVTKELSALLSVR